MDQQQRLEAACRGSRYEKRRGPASLWLTMVEIQRRQQSNHDREARECAKCWNQDADAAHVKKQLL